VSKDFVRCFSLPTRKSKVTTLVRLANGQRVAFSTVNDINFELSRHECQRTFNVLRDLCVVDMLLGLPWPDDEQASMQFGTMRVFTMMGGISVVTQTKERILACLLM
jgi:hypothetical protein